MMFSPSYMPFFGTLILGTFITISSSTWFGSWIGLELNMLSFIPLITIKMNFYFSESALKYFLIQALGSTLFISASCMYLTLTFISSPLILLSLLLKLGSAPFHFWFPQVMEGMAWPQAIMLMTIQKIAPMVLISYLLTYPMLTFITSLSAILSAMTGALGGFNTMSLRKLMAFSSINHLSWMLISITIADVFWMLYFIFYSILTLSVVILFSMFQAYTLSDLMKSNQINSSFNLFIPLNLLSLGGLPPLSGFIPKWMLIQLLINNKLFIPLFFLLVSALITLYFYLRIIMLFIILTNPIMSVNVKLNPMSSLSFFMSSFTLFNMFMLTLPLMFFMF
uniref:NADH dehydrogenase subunit 2 n=1 Tax=Potamon fluviatile TaxID=511340 RepID=UPI00226CABB2|nr:NADH dehydrogenase subunit 2 [Potamon fluviatile]UZH44822.1 NADH dehydrogenase subunit 2 [Potamon fluviatile]